MLSCNYKHLLPFHEEHGGVEGGGQGRGGVKLIYINISQLKATFELFFKAESSNRNCSQITLERSMNKWENPEKMYKQRKFFTVCV